MQILGLLDMYFDAVVLFVTNSSLLFRFSMAILCQDFDFFNCYGCRLFIWKVSTKVSRKFSFNCPWNCFWKYTWNCTWNCPHKCTWNFPSKYNFVSVLNLIFIIWNGKRSLNFWTKFWNSSHNERALQLRHAPASQSWIETYTLKMCSRICQRIEWI